MRTAILALVILLAGCTSANEGASPSDVEGETPPEMAMALPADWVINATMPPSLGTPGVGIAPDCTLAAEVCQRYPISLGRRGIVTAHMEVVAADLDLHVMQGNSAIASSENLQSDEFLRVALEPGEYDVVVQGNAAASGTGGVGASYQLAVYFDEPRSPNP